jgi:DNA-binding transcriptional MerR regulator
MMKNSTGRALYQVREFAERSGVTIRTLHHYDHLGLLKPAVYSEAGYRLYSDDDFVRLQQIVTLKFLGFSLKQIHDLLDGEVLDLPGMFRLQRDIMGEKRRQLDLAIQAIDAAERTALRDAPPDRELFLRIIEVINMEQSYRDKDWMKKYYTEEQLAEFARRAEANPGEAEQGQRDWKVLIEDVEKALADGVDPASEEGKGLAARWSEMISRFTLGNPETEASLRKLYADSANWPSTFKKPYSEEVEAFIGKAFRAAGIGSRFGSGA